MESVKTPPSFKRGFLLVTVLILAVIGMLIGAGALLVYRGQCKTRIERQHELEKLYAVRSILNYMRNMYAKLGSEGSDKLFRYHTCSDRDLGLIVKHASPCFPTNDISHFDIANTNHFKISVDQYDIGRDYEYGSWGTTNTLTKQQICSDVEIGEATGKIIANGIKFGDNSATNGVKWWLNIGMKDIQGWQNEEFGRRYLFRPCRYVGDGDKKKRDIVRLCLIRDVLNPYASVGCRHGWPLSKSGERALVLEVAPDEKGKADIGISEIVNINGTNKVQQSQTLLRNCETQCYMGIQLAGNRASVFYVGKGQLNEYYGDQRFLGFTMSAPVEISELTYNYFKDGAVTNADKEVVFPDIRAVLEVEAASSARNGDCGDSGIGYDFLTGFQVMPAYQYEIDVEYPMSTTNRATVAQRMGTYDRDTPLFSVFSYDTHSWKHWGYRNSEYKNPEERVEE